MLNFRFQVVYQERNKKAGGTSENGALMMGCRL